jgi:ATP/maltotriose-dependent transcriptional regulator MalT/DNA-binding SARP family transcriptional activator
MLPAYFLKTKLLPPRLTTRVLARPRLIERMRDFLDRPATVLCANAGCGKTTLVTDFIRSINLPAVWYQIDPADVDLAVFFGYLVYGLRQRQPAFGHVTLGLISETENLSKKANQLVDVFINEVSEQLEEKTLLVLDDYHHVDSSEPIAAAIDRLVQYLPDVLHLIFTTRSVPNLSVMRLRSKGVIGFLNRQDLLFTPAEVEQLFAETFRQQLPAELVSRFHEKTDGWVTALQLIQQSLDHSEDARGAAQSANRALIESALQQSEMEVFDYFAEEVLQFETPETRLMLGRLSLPARIDPAICEAALGINDCTPELRNLTRRNVFIAQAYGSGAEESYRLHPLFRSFLARWLANEVGTDEIRRLHKACAAYFVSVQQWSFALDHFTEAGSADDVAEMLAAHGEELVAAGRFETIKRAFDGLTERALGAYPRALITRADVALIESDSARAAMLYSKAEQVGRASADAKVQAEALRGQSYIARHTGDCDGAIRLATAAIELAPDHPALRARCFNTIGLCSFTARHDSDGAIQNWRAALDEARKAGDDRFARIALHNLGLPYSLEGDFHEALRWLSQMIEDEASVGQATKPAPSPFPQEAIAHLNIARLKIVQGRLDEAEAHLERALERCQLFNLKTATGETLEAFGNLYRERNEFTRALDFYDEAARAYRDAGVALTDKELLDERAALYLRMGDVRMAAREADEYFRARAERSDVERSTALITRGRIELAAGRLDEAEAALAEAARLAGESKLYYNEARAETSLARVFWQSERAPQALAHLEYALALSRRYDYAYWLASEARLAPALIVAAMQAGIATEYLARVAPPETAEVAPARLSSAEGAPSVAASGVSARPDALVELFIERPNVDLIIRMLGPAEIYRDPTEPLKDAWRLVKSLHILCYIAARRNHRAPKEQIIETFWSDADTETIAKNFHPTISHMRKALNTGQVVKKDFVLYREGAYLLNPQYQYRIDAEEFERLLGDAREARRNSDDEGAAQLLAEAIKLYRGDFLEELYYNWVEELQSYYRDLYFEALKELIAYHRGQGRHDQVLRYGQMLLARDPYQEDVHCALMEAHVALGNRAAAIDQFDGLRRMLRRELGVDPLPATIARYEALIK